MTPSDLRKSLELRSTKIDDPSMGPTLSEREREFYLEVNAIVGLAFFIAVLLIEAFKSFLILPL